MKTKRLIITGIASDCAPASGKQVRAPLPIMNSSNSFFSCNTRRDVKPIAKNLIARFGSFGEVIAADPGRLAEIEGISAGAISEFKIVEAAAQRFAKGAVKKRLPLGSWSEVIDYCRTSMAFEGRESFRILFLDKCA